MWFCFVLLTPPATTTSTEEVLIGPGADSQNMLLEEYTLRRLRENLLALVLGNCIFGAACGPAWALGRGLDGGRATNLLVCFLLPLVVLSPIISISSTRRTRTSEDSFFLLELIMHGDRDDPCPWELPSLWKGGECTLLNILPVVLVVLNCSY